MRFFLVEAAQVTVRSDPEWRSRYPSGFATRTEDRQGGDGAQNGVRLYVMWRKQCDWEEWKKFSPHMGELGTGVGLK
jgi:hypothetical protein